MFRKWCFESCVAVGVVMVTVGVAQAITIDLVPVGNAGNLPDTRYRGISVGGVDKDYAIGEYEITAGQYRDFLNAVAATDSYGLYNPSMYSSFSGCKIRQLGTSGGFTYLVDANGDGVEDAAWVNRPVNFVSWGDAARFANWLHNGQPTGAQVPTTTEDGSYYLNGATTVAALMAVTRGPGATWVIPTQDEWYKAAYHDKTAGLAATYFDYPTKSNTAPINTLLPSDPGNHANFYDYNHTGNSGYTIGSPYYRTEVGAFTSSDSPYGTFDQGGNVWEWNETAGGEGSRILRGGAFNYGSDGLAAFVGSDTDPTNEYSSWGFRVAIVPEPGSIVLLAVGAVGLLAYAWRRKQMRWLMIAALLPMVIVGSAQASTNVDNLFNTGVDNNGVLLPDGTLGDPHYSLVVVPQFSTSTVRVRSEAGGFPVDADGQWLLDDGLSNWIGPNNRGDLHSPIGYYTYHTTCDVLSDGLIELSGRWSADNHGTMRFDGNLVASTDPGTLQDDFTRWTPFAVELQASAGWHDLDFVVENYGGPSGLRVEFTPVPEPATIALLGVGALGLLAFAWRRRHMR